MSNRYETADPLDRFIGKSPPVEAMKTRIRRIAKTTLPVIVTGEIGSGKGLVGQIVHELSGRQGKLIHIDVAALPDSLLMHAELVGYTQGAFTGATRDRQGALQLAAGGTVVLDELDMAPPALQTVITKFMDTGTIKVLGTSVDIPIDVRVVSLTRGLSSQAPTLHVDLVDALAGAVIEVPPLRSRTEDIPLLVEHFLASGSFDKELHRDALDVLRGYHFPGNVRELANMIKQAAILSEHKLIESTDLFGSHQTMPEPQQDSMKLEQSLYGVQKELERLRRTSIPANPIWEGRSFPTEHDYCFVLMPFSPADDVQSVYHNHIRPRVLQRCGLRCERADDIHDINGVMQSVWEGIQRARVIIAEMTGRNPNVFYELGIAHTLGKPVIMITQSMDYIPSDLRHLRCIVYQFKPGSIEQFEEALDKTVNRVLSSR